jgi:hypothetical protein
MSKLQEKTSALKREHPALQKMKIITFFLCLWVIFALLDPDPGTDPGTPLNPDSIRIRIHNTGFGSFLKSRTVVRIRNSWRLDQEVFDLG